MSRFSATEQLLHFDNPGAAGDQNFVKMIFPFQCDLITLHPDIIIVATVVLSPWSVRTVIQIGFMALAPYTVQPDGAAARQGTFW